MKRRMQRLDAAVEHFREAGHGRHVRHGQPGRLERSRCAARGHQLEAACREAAGHLVDARLVRDAQQGSWHINRSPVLSSGRRAGLAPKGKGRMTRPFFLPRQRLPGWFQRRGSFVGVVASRKKNDAYHR